MMFEFVGYWIFKLNGWIMYFCIYFVKKKKIFTLKKLKSTYTWTIDWFKIHFYSRMAAEPLQLAPIGLFLQCWVSTFWYPQERTCLKLKFRVRTISIDFQTSEWCHNWVPNKRRPLWLIKSITSEDQNKLTCAFQPAYPNYLRKCPKNAQYEKHLC